MPVALTTCLAEENVTTIRTTHSMQILSERVNDLKINIKKNKLNQ